MAAPEEEAGEFMRTAAARSRTASKRGLCLVAGWLWGLFSLAWTPSSATFCQIFIAAFDRFRHDLDPGVAVGLGTELIALYGFF